MVTLNREAANDREGSLGERERQFILVQPTIETALWPEWQWILTCGIFSIVLMWEQQNFKVIGFRKLQTCYI